MATNSLFGNPDFESALQQEEQQQGLPAGLLRAQIQQESGGNPNAVSRTGAQGLMQLMPGTQHDLGVQNAMDWRQNLHGGALYDRQMLDKSGGDVPAALAGYNWGPSHIPQALAGQALPPETQNYQQSILSKLGNIFPAASAAEMPAQGTGAYFQMPSGKYYTYNPQQVSPAQAEYMAKMTQPQDFLPPGPPAEPSMLGSLMKGTKGWAESTMTGVQALWDPEGAARSAIENNKALEQQYGTDSGWQGVVDAYNQNGFVSGAAKFAQNFGLHPLAENTPMLAAAMAGGAAGQLAIPIPGVGAALGAALALAPSMLSSNVERQAEEQLKSNPDGGLNIAMGPALAATAGQAVANVGALRFMGAKFIAPFLKAAETDGIAAAEAKLLQVAKSSVAGAAAKGAAVMPADMVMQTVLSRWQSGQSLLSPDAIDEYGKTAAGAVTVGAVFGGLSHFGTPEAAKARLDQIQAERDQQNALLLQQQKEAEEKKQLSTASAWTPGGQPGAEMRPLFEAQMANQMEAFVQPPAPPPVPPPTPKFWVNPITGEREKVARSKPTETQPYAPAEDWQALLNVPGGDALIPPDALASIQRLHAQQRAEAAQAEFAPREEPLQTQPLQVTPEPGTAALLGGHGEMDQIQAGIDAAAAEQAAKVRVARQQQLLPADNVTDFTRRGLINIAREKQEELLEQINTSAQAMQELRQQTTPENADPAIAQQHMDEGIKAEQLKQEYLQWAEREAAERRAHLGLEPLTPEMADDIRTQNSALLDELLVRGGVPPEERGPSQFLPDPANRRRAGATVGPIEKPFGAPERAQAVIEQALDKIRQFSITPTEEERARWAESQKYNNPRQLPVLVTPPGELFPLGAWPKPVRGAARTDLQQLAFEVSGVKSPSTPHLETQRAIEGILHEPPVRPKRGKGLASLGEMVGTDRTPFHVRGLLNDLANFFSKDLGSPELLQAAHELVTDVHEGRGYALDLVNQLRRMYDVESRAQVDQKKQLRMPEIDSAIALVDKIRLALQTGNEASPIVRETAQAFAQREQKAGQLASIKIAMSKFEQQVAKLNEASKKALNKLDAEFRQAMEREKAPSPKELPPGEIAWQEEKAAKKFGLTQTQVERLTEMLTQHHMLLTRMDELSSDLAKLHDTTNAYHPEEMRIANMKRTLLARMDAIQADRAKVDDLPERIAGRKGQLVKRGTRQGEEPIQAARDALMAKWGGPEKPALPEAEPVEGQQELGKALWAPEVPQEATTTAEGKPIYRKQTRAEKAQLARDLVTGDVKRKNPFAKGPSERAADKREHGDETGPGIYGDATKPGEVVVGNPAQAKMKKGKRGLTRQGDGPQAQHVDYDQASTRIKALQAELGDKVEITHGHDGKEAPTELAAEMAQEGVDPDSVKGWLSADGKRLWINNGAHANLKDLEGTLAHEIVGHRKAIPLIEQAWKDRGGFHGFALALDGSAGGGVDRLLKDLGIDQKYKDADLDTKAKEAIAAMEERRPSEGMTDTIRRAWKELVGAVRDWMRQHGLLDYSQASDYDIYNLLRQARNADHLRDANVGDHGLASKAKPFDGPRLETDEIAKRVFGEPQSRITQFKDKVGDMFGLPNAIKYFDRFAGWTKAVDQLKKEGNSEAVRDLPTQLQYDLRMFARNGMLAGLAMKTGVMRVVHKTVGQHTERHYEASGPKATEYDDILRKGNRDPEAFNLYMIAKRADRLGWNTLPPGVRDGATEAHWAKLVKEGDADPVFQAAREAYTNYNKSLLKFLMDTGYASPQMLGFKDGGKWQLHPEDYIPFYRKDVNGDFTIEYGALQAPIKVGNLNDLPDLKQLIGGKQHLVDMMTGTITNTSTMYRLGLGNQAATTAVHALQAMGIGREMPPGAKGNDIIHYRTWDPETGEQLEKAYRVDNIGGSYPTGSIPGEILVKSLEGLPLSMPPIVRALAQPANWMRHLTLASPFYMMRQMMKEPLAMWLGSGADTSILWQTTADFGRTLAGFAGGAENAQRERALKLGLVSGATLMGDASVAARELMERSHKPWQVLLASFEKAGIAADSAVRDVYLDQMLKKGMSERDAILATAVNTVDFFQKGLSPSLGMLRQMVPFFSSQLAALDTFKKALLGQLPFEEKLKIQQKFIQRGALLAAGSIMYAILSKDQQYYQNADDDSKYGNWMIPFKMNGVDEPVVMHVPIPYEYAYLFKILPEMLVNRLAGDANNAEMFNTVKQTLLDSTPGITPQAIKPFIEAYTNKNFFTGRPILSDQQQKLPQNDRSTPYTTYWARQLGFEIANVQGTSYGVSPIWIEHFTKSLAGPIGIAAMQIASMPFEDRPARNLSEMPLGGGTFQSPYGERYVNRLEGILSEATSYKDEYDKMIKERRFDDAAEFMRDPSKSKQYALASAAPEMQGSLQDLNKAKMAIWFNSNIPADERRRQINQLTEQELRLAKTFGQTASSLAP